MTDSAAPRPADADERAAQAAELLDRGRSTLARGLLGEALRASPDHSGLLFQAARADVQEDDPQSARQTLERLLAREPSHVGARLLLLSIFTDLHQLADAERLAIELIREYPQAAALYAAYARVMLPALEFAKARRLAAEALRLEPDNDDALCVAALCDLVEGRSADSQALGQLLRDHPRDQRTLSLTAAALVESNRHAEALRCARELLRLDPREPAWLRLVQELRYARHWSMRPLWPLQKWGWGAAIALWIGGIVLVRTLAGANPALANTLSWLIVGYALYSWVWPPILRRMMVRER